MKKFKDSKKLNYFANNFMNESMKFKYSYKFDWLSRPIIQYPQDIIAIPVSIIKSGFTFQIISCIAIIS